MYHRCYEQNHHVGYLVSIVSQSLLYCSTMIRIYNKIDQEIINLTKFIYSIFLYVFHQYLCYKNRQTSIQRSDYYIIIYSLLYIIQSYIVFLFLYVL